METVRPSLSTQKANDSFTYRILQCQRSQVLRPSVRLPRFRHEKQRCVFPLLGNERRSTIPPFLQARKNYVSKFMCMHAPAGSRSTTRCGCLTKRYTLECFRQLLTTEGNSWGTRMNERMKISLPRASDIVTQRSKLLMWCKKMSLFGSSLESPSFGFR